MFGKILSSTVNICAYEFGVYSFLYVIKYIIVNDYLCHLCGVILTLKNNGCDSINDIEIYEFVFKGLPNPPDLEGMDEDRLFELQQNVQEQLHKRDEERERNITKRVQEFEKTFDFVNSHLLKGVATMAELTKTDIRQSLGKIKPTDKMVMMPGLFDGTKLETSKQHYERFNMYIKFQSKSGHLTDPVGEAIDLFKHTLDKTA